jgi:hypothetical protein
MSILPTASFLGKLEIIEVYEYYDKPVLFTCRNAVDTTYLVVLVSESDASSTWLYAALSRSRLQDIRQSKVDLYTAFTQAEDELVYEVTVFQTSHPAQLRVLPITALSDEQLPMRGAFLNLPSDNPQIATG